MITFNQAYLWLNMFERSFLTRHSSIILNQMRQAKDANDNPKVMFYMERICKICDSNRPEKAEAQIECAKILYEMGDLARPVELLDDARKDFIGDNHRMATVLWMQGYLFWEILSKHDDAMIVWNNAITIFERILDMPQVPFNKTQWYTQIIEEMKIALDEAILNDGV